MPRLICPLKESRQQEAHIVSKARVEASVNCSQTNAQPARSIRQQLVLMCRCLARKHLMRRETCCYLRRGCHPGVSSPVLKYLP